MGRRVLTFAPLTRCFACFACTQLPVYSMTAWCKHAHLYLCPLLCCPYLFLSSLSLLVVPFFFCAFSRFNSNRESFVVMNIPGTILLAHIAVTFHSKREPLSDLLSLSINLSLFLALFSIHSPSIAPNCFSLEQL